MLQQEVIELIERLNQERLFVGSDLKAITKLNEEVSRTAADTFKCAWVAQQQRRNLAALMQNESKAVLYCRRASQLENVTFTDGYKYLNQHEPKYGEWLSLLRSDPPLLAAQLLQAERVSLAAASAANVSGTSDITNSNAASELVSILLSSVFGCCVMRSDEAAVAEMLLVLARNAYSSNNSTSVHRRSNSMFHLVFTQFIECLPSVRLFLISALQPAVMLVLMKDDSQYDLDPQKTYHSYVTARRPPSRSSFPPGGDNTATLDRETVAAAAARHRAAVALQMVEVLRCLISSIRRSLHCFPPALMWLVNRIYHCLMQNEGCTHENARAACTDVVFESFICPALLNAAAHGLSLDAPVSSVAQHNLTEVARILKILAHSRSRQMGSVLQPSVAGQATVGDDILSRIDQDGLSDIIDALITKTAPEKPPFSSNDVSSMVRTTILLTLSDLRRLVSFEKIVAQSLPNGDATRVRTEELLSELPALPSLQPSGSSLQASGLSAVASVMSSPVSGSGFATPPGTPPVTRSKSGKKLSIVGPSIAIAASLAAATAAGSPSQPATQTQTAPSSDLDAKPEEVFVITFRPSNQEVGLVPECKVMAMMEEQSSISHVARRNTSDGEGLVKRTRFSLTSATAHSGGVGDVSELGDVVSEAASVHSVGSTTLDNEDMGIDPDADDDDDLSDMVSANVSGRGSPCVSGRDTPQSSAGAGAEGEGASGAGVDDENRGSESTGSGRICSSSRPPPVANIPVTIKKAEEDLPDRFGMFDIRSQISRAAAGAIAGDLEVRSTYSDTWSTDVLGGSDVGGTAGGGADDDEDDDGDRASRRRLQHRLLEIDDDAQVAGNALSSAQLHVPPTMQQQPPQQQQPQRPLSASLFLLGGVSGGPSETASESAWSTDVLAASDTSERPSERLRELDNIEEQLQNMGFAEAASSGRANVDDVDSVASENSDMDSSSDSSLDNVGTERQGLYGTLRPRQSTSSKLLLEPGDLVDTESRSQRNAASSGTAARISGTPTVESGTRNLPTADYRQCGSIDSSSFDNSSTGAASLPPAGVGGILSATPVWRPSSVPSSSRSADLMEMFDPLAAPTGQATIASTQGTSLPPPSIPSAWPNRKSDSGSNMPSNAYGFSMLSSSLPAGKSDGVANADDVSRNRSSRPTSHGTSNGSDCGEANMLPISSTVSGAARPPTWPMAVFAQPRMPTLGTSAAVQMRQHGASSLQGSRDSGIGWTNQDDNSMPSDAWEPFAPDTQWKDNLTGAGEVPPASLLVSATKPVFMKSDSVRSNEEALTDLGLDVGMTSSTTTSTPASVSVPGAPVDERQPGDKKKKSSVFQSLKISIKGKRKDQVVAGVDNKLYDARVNAPSADDAAPSISGNAGSSAPNVGASGAASAATSGVAGDAAGDDILAKYRSAFRQSAPELGRPHSVGGNESEALRFTAPLERSSASAQMPTFDPRNLENCSAFGDAKKKLRLVLSHADAEALRHVGCVATQAGPSQGYDPCQRLCDDDNDIVRLLQVLLSQAISLQRKPVIAQLYETIRCLRQFKQKSACRKLLRAMKEDYRRRVHYITYLTRSRQGLMVSLAHLQRAHDLQMRDREVCQSCFVTECVRIYLHKKERALVDLRDGFAQLSAPDEKCDMVERGLDALCQDMDRDAIWLAANEQQLDAAQFAIERHVMAFVYQEAMFPNSNADLERDRIFHESVQRLGQGLKPTHPELKIPAKYHMEFPWKSAQEEIVMLNLYKTPRDKLQCVVCCSKVIMNLLSMAGEERNVPAADDFLPVFICVVALANPEYLLSTVQYVDSFYGRRMDGEETYWWMQLKSAVAFITMWMQKETLVTASSSAE